MNPFDDDLDNTEYDETEAEPYDEDEDEIEEDRADMDADEILFDDDRLIDNYEDEGEED